MPSNGTISDHVSVFRLATAPSDPHRKVIKRNRQVVSCTACRSRKLRCDRRQPCGSCLKRSDAEGCRFFGPAAAGGAAGARASDGGLGQKEELRARLLMLEDEMVQPSHSCC